MCGRAARQRQRRCRRTTPRRRAGSAPVDSAATGASTPEDDLTIGFVTHVVGNPFIQQIIDAAEFAAEDLGVAIEVTGPAGGDADAQLTAAQNVVSAGADGLAVSVPGESMANGLNDIVDSGVPVVQFNLLSTSVDAPYVGERSMESGRILGAAGARAARRCRGDRPGDPRQLLPRLPGAGEPGRRRAGGARRGARPGDPRARSTSPSIQHRTTPRGSRCWRPTPRPSPSSACAPRTWPASDRSRRRTPTTTSSPAATTSPRTTWRRSRTASPTWRSARRRSCRATCRCTCSSTRCATARSSSCRSSMPAPRSSPPTGSSSRSGCPELTFDELLELAASPEAAREYYQPLVDGVIAEWQDHVEPIEAESA